MTHGEYAICRVSHHQTLRRDVSGVILTFWTEDDADAKRCSLPDPSNWYVRKLTAQERGGNRSRRVKKEATA